MKVTGIESCFHDICTQSESSERWRSPLGPSLAPSADEVANQQLSLIRPLVLCLCVRSLGRPLPSAEERSGGDRLLPLAPEEGGLPVDPVHCHRLH